MGSWKRGPSMPHARRAAAGLPRPEPHAVAGQYATEEKPEVTADQTSSAGQLPTRRGLWPCVRSTAFLQRLEADGCRRFLDRSRSHGFLSRACWRRGSVRLIGNGLGLSRSSYGRHAVGFLECEWFSLPASSAAFADAPKADTAGDACIRYERRLLRSHQLPLWECRRRMSSSDRTVWNRARP